MAEPPGSGIDVAGLAARLDEVRSAIGTTARAVGRDPEELTLIVVTKTHTVDLAAALVELGAFDLGENRHQEAVGKAETLAGTPARWHMIGQLQSNKAKAVRRYATSVHSVDRASLVNALASDEDDAVPLDVFLQVNLTDDPGRGGVAPTGLESLAETIAGAPGLTLRGVMAVAPLDEAPAAAFAHLADYSARVRRVVPTASAISAGMSHDWPEAIAAGATHLRVGSAITGNRPPRP